MVENVEEKELMKNIRFFNNMKIFEGWNFESIKKLYI